MRMGMTIFSAKFLPCLGLNFSRLVICLRGLCIEIPVTHYRLLLKHKDTTSPKMQCYADTAWGKHQIFIRIDILNCIDRLIEKNLMSLATLVKNHT